MRSLWSLLLGAVAALSAAPPPPALPEIGTGYRLYRGWGYPAGNPRHGIVEYVTYSKVTSIFLPPSGMDQVVWVWADSWEDARRQASRWTADRLELWRVK